MKFVPILVILVGVLLLYSAKTDKDPRNIVVEALGYKPIVKDFSPIGEGRSVGTWVQPGASYESPAIPGQKVVTV